MLLKKQVKAGILLYALLMSAVFSLFLQFYLERINASQRQAQAQLKQTKTSLITQIQQTEKSTENTENFSTDLSHQEDKLGEVSTQSPEEIIEPLKVNH